MKVKEIKEKYFSKSIPELKKELNKLEAELIKRRLELKLSKLKQSHLIGQLSYENALVKTLIREKEIIGLKGES